MLPAPPARLKICIPLLLGLAGPAGADVGGTLSLQTDARERGLSYSNNRPSAQLGLAWDGSAGWYAGAQLSRVRFDDQRHGARVQAYGGHVFEIVPGLNGEAGLVAYRFENVSRYDFTEVYAGLLGELWSLRLYHSGDYYGIGQRSLYAELNLRWPLLPGLQAIGHAGVIKAEGGQRLPYVEPRGSTRTDLRAGLSWQVGSSSDLQLAWVSASRGGPYTWTDPTRRSTAVLALTTAF
jgi:uncharacterized protein (TIGR02001 family)